MAHIHQLGAYYGIFYTSDIIDDVDDAIRTSKKFADLVGEDDEVDVKGVLLFTSTNSDFDELETMYFIAVDEMTIGGPDVDSMDQIYMQVEPREMVKCEAENAHAAEPVTDLYEIIIKYLKYKKIPLSNIYMGWSIFPCIWDPKYVDD